MKKRFVFNFFNSSKDRSLNSNLKMFGLAKLLCRRLTDGPNQSLRQHRELQKILRKRFLAVVFARTHTYNFLLAKQQLARGMCEMMLQKLETLVEKGHTPAIAFLAWILHRGVDGISPNSRRRLHLLQQGVNLGCPDCQGEMAMYIYNRRNPGETLVVCREMAEKSAHQGSEYGMYALSCILEPDFGKENAKTCHVESNRMLIAAAEKKHPYALSTIAMASEHGWRGLNKDSHLALDLYRRAAQGGDFSSFDMCGRLEFEMGNHAAAIWWLERAVKTGNLCAVAILKEIHDATDAAKRRKM